MCGSGCDRDYHKKPEHGVMPKPKQGKGKSRSIDQDVEKLDLFASGRTADPTGVVRLVDDDSGHRFLVYATSIGMRVDLRYEGRWQLCSVSNSRQSVNTYHKFLPTGSS
jgi:hypothetical protein